MRPAPLTRNSKTPLVSSSLVSSSGHVRPAPLETRARWSKYSSRIALIGEVVAGKEARANEARQGNKSQ